MTADRPTTTEVDFFTWNRHFHGVRKHGAPDERPVKLTPAVARIACVIAAHINNESRNAKIGHRRIADCAQVSTSTVESAVEILEAAGWLLVSRETKTSQQGGKHNGTNRYRLASPVAALQADPPVDNSDDTDEGAPISGAPLPQSAGHPCPNQRGETTNSLRTRTTNQRISVSAADRVDSKVGEKKATSLPATWTPNRTHRKVAENVDVDALAAEFRVTMDGEKRTDWDKAFGAFIKDYLEGRSEVTFAAQADDVDPFAPSTSSVVDLGPDPTAQALDWIAPALWAEGLHPDALTADERAEVVLSHDPGVDPRDVASRIRANRVVSQVAKHVGPMSSDEVAHVVDGVAHDYSDVDGLALDIRNARRGKALMIRAGDDPAGKDVGRLAAIWLECAEEDGEPLPGDPLDRYRSPIPA